MTAAFKSLAMGGVLALAATLPAVAMPVGAPSIETGIVTVSGWATRAEGRRHTYPDHYGYGYVDGYARAPYGRPGGVEAYGVPYGVYGQGVPSGYGYGGGYGAY